MWDNGTRPVLYMTASRFQSLNCSMRIGGMFPPSFEILFQSSLDCHLLNSQATSWLNDDIEGRIDFPLKFHYSFLLGRGG